MELDTQCEMCGTGLTCKPGTNYLTCNYCNHDVDLPDPLSNDQAQAELDFLDHMDDFERNGPHIEKWVVNCTRCGAETEFQTHQQSGFCPFCDTPIIVKQAHTRKVIKPKGLLPFNIEKKIAIKNFKSWLSQLWFAPNDLKKRVTRHEKFNGMYLPFWTYDCNTVSSYRGELGMAYYVTVSYTDAHGKSQSRQERRIRWSSVSGTVNNNFNDVMVPASESLPEDKLCALEPWDLEELVDYNDSYLSGYLTETYQIDLKTGYLKAKAIMDRKIRDLVKADIGGNEQRISSIGTRYNEITFKHLLLPVWVSAYRYQDKLFQILVNARTGEVQGQRPWSWIKISLGIIAGLIAAGGILYLFYLLSL